MVKSKKDKPALKKTAQPKKASVKATKPAAVKKAAAKPVRAVKEKKPAVKAGVRKKELLEPVRPAAAKVSAHPVQEAPRLHHPLPQETHKPLHKEPAPVVKEAPRHIHKEPAAPVKEAPKPIHPQVQEQTKPVHREAAATVKEAPRPAHAPIPAPAQTVAKPAVAQPAVPVKKPAEEKPAAAAVAPAPVPAQPSRVLEVELPVTLKDLAIKLQEKPSSLIKALMGMGLMVGINQLLNEQAVAKVCAKYNCAIHQAPGQEEISLRVHSEQDKAETLIHRAPVVTFMGHVDHGKTSLLDAIRKTKVAESEHGGITQHIGAYRVVLPAGEITFLDTPGHEAFTAMRARGASITDIVVLVVAADDGVMPQTQEAIDHARAAGVPIIVALNKIDKPQASADRVKKQLAECDLLAEDWGGKTITVSVSAKTGQGIDTILEMILLEAQMLELKANPKRLAKGIIIEAKMSKGRGPVATFLVQNGTLHLNANVIVGSFYCKVRAMFDDHGRAVTAAGPSVPVEVLGLSGVPEAGEQFFAIADEKEARELVRMRQEKERQQQVKAVKRISLEDLHAQIQAGKLKELKLIVKSDVQGSLGAIKDTLEKLNVSEIKLDIIHAGVGNINSSDVVLAVASNALVLGFNVDADERSRELAVKEGIEIQMYNIIYELANEIKAAIEGMLEPKLKKVFQGRAEVRKVFKLSRSGTIAGCMVSKGKLTRQAQAQLFRNGEVVFEGKISSLKRFKDDVREVAEGFECGLSVGDYEGYQEGDVVETFEIEKILRKLS